MEWILALSHTNELKVRLEGKPAQHQQRLSRGSREKTVPSKVSPILNPSCGKTTRMINAAQGWLLSSNMPVLSGLEPQRKEMKEQSCEVNRDRSRSNIKVMLHLQGQNNMEYRFQG
ncbi:hypothetical protein CHARACLAT_028987 [Characodon lateralis]|uniref:Uncharacterized protein n=1 Tax=Characodon lateralis TaxID=208331 RepID=A0ABU7EXX6_9TELE|nr:hypothetical protein [Characodon lateralis]